MEWGNNYFHLINANTTAIELYPDEVFVFSVVYSPRTNTISDGVLIVEHNAPGSPSSINIRGLGVKVSESDCVDMPLVTGLIGNFPNPFNPYTTIRFVVGGSRFENPHPSPLLVGGGKGAVFGQRAVHIEIFNIRGQRVRTLLDGSQEFGAGEHSVVWDGRDDDGRTLSSGVYFYRMRAGEYTETRRMLLLK